MDPNVLNGLPDGERRTMVFLKAYEDIRRDAGQFGYTALPKDCDDVLSCPTFKQFNTVREWLEGEGWKVTWAEAHWKGFISFAFEAMKPTVPHPGQLKNKVLLKRYVASAPKVIPKPIRTPEELEALYSKILHPKIANDAVVRGILGIPKHVQ